MIYLLNIFRICSELSVNVQNLFRIFSQCSECSVMFRLYSEYLAQKLVCSELHDFVEVGYSDCRWNCGSVQ